VFKDLETIMRGQKYVTAGHQNFWTNIRRLLFYKGNAATGETFNQHQYSSVPANLLARLDKLMSEMLYAHGLTREKLFGLLMTQDEVCGRCVPWLSGAVGATIVVACMRACVLTYHPLTRNAPALRAHLTRLRTTGGC